MSKRFSTCCLLCVKDFVSSTSNAMRLSITSRDPFGSHSSTTTIAGCHNFFPQSQWRPKWSIIEAVKALKKINFFTLRRPLFWVVLSEEKKSDDLLFLGRRRRQEGWLSEEVSKQTQGFTQLKAAFHFDNTSESSAETIRCLCVILKPEHLCCFLCTFHRQETLLLISRWSTPADSNRSYDLILQI